MKLWLLLTISTALLGQTSSYNGLGNSSPYTDTGSIVWASDSGCTTSTQFTVANTIQGTNDPTLYQHGRLSTSAFSCTYSVTNSIFYTITLKFANTQGFTAGQRIFNIFINNALVRANFDLAATAPANTAFDLGFIIPVSTGQVVVNLQPTSGGVLLNAIGITAIAPGTLTSNNTWTGNNTFVGLISAKTLEKRVYADQFAGGDWGAQVLAAATSLGSTGGIVDATGFAQGSTFTITTSPLAGINVPITLLTGNYTLQWNPASVQFDLPANCHLQGDQTLFLNTNPNGIAIFSDPLMQATDFIASRLYKTTGSITSGQATLTVASTTGIQVGTRVGVWGGTTSNANQQTTINQGGGIGVGDTSFIVTSTSGWDLTRLNDLILLEIQSELLTCTGGTGTTFTGCTRGVFGTTAATHINGSNVTHAGVFLAQVLSIAGNVLTLDTNAGRTVTSATVWAGADNVQIDGKLTIDGAQSQSGTDNSMPCILGAQATHFIVGQGIKLRRCEHGGFFIYGGMLNDFAGGVELTGKPPNRLGADVWAFASSIKNNFHPAYGISGDAGFFFDDRSVNVDPWVGSSNGNTFRGTSLENYTTCVLVEGGSSDNEVSLGKCKATLATAQAILVDTAQWTTNPAPSNNHVSVGTVDATGQVALTTAFYTSLTSNNKIDVGMIQGGSIALANAADTITWRDGSGYHIVGEAQSTALPTINRAAAIVDTNPTMGSGTFKGYAVLGVCRGFNDAPGDKCYGGWFKATAANNSSTEVGLHVESADAAGKVYEVGTTAGNKEILNGDGGHLFIEQAGVPATQVNVDTCYADSTAHALKCSYNNGTYFQISQVLTATSAAFATATTAGTCVQNTTVVTNAATSMAVSISPVSTPGVGAVWSAFVSSAGNVTINECAVATSAGGTIAFNIRVTP